MYSKLTCFASFFFDLKAILSVLNPEVLCCTAIEAGNADSGCTSDTILMVNRQQMEE
jgi:hypothetical protein